MDRRVGAPMNLYDAFSALRPSPEPVEPARFQQACEVVWRELCRLASQVLAADSPAVREDAVNTVLLRVASARKRRGRMRALGDVTEVQKYLSRALRNAVVDLHRDSRLRERTDAAQSVVVDGPEERFVIAEACAANHREVHEAQQELFEDIVPGIAAESGAGRRAAETIALLRDLRDEKRRMADVVQDEAGADTTAEGLRRARNRLDQRFARALRRLHEEIDRRAASGCFAPERADTLRRLARSLRLRRSAEER